MAEPVQRRCPGCNRTASATEPLTHPSWCPGFAAGIPSAPRRSRARALLGGGLLVVGLAQMLIVTVLDGPSLWLLPGCTAVLAALDVLDPPTSVGGRANRSR